MATNETLKKMLSCDIGSTFGITNEQLAKWISTTSQYTARFNVWLGDDYNKCLRVLEIVQGQGMSPALFVAKELAEGYSSYGGGLGWHNHTYPKGDPYVDAQFVANYTVTLDGTQHWPSWIDYGNPVNCVPQSVQDAGNAEYASWGNQTIGKKYCAMTAAAAWGTWYPAALSASVNGVANYGNPLQQCADFIFDTMGGTFDGQVATGGDSGGKNDTGSITTEVNVDMSEARENVKKAIQEIFNDNLSKLSDSYYTNQTLTAFRYGNIENLEIDENKVNDIINIIKDVKKEVTVDTGSKDENGNYKPPTDGSISGNARDVSDALQTMVNQLGTAYGSGQCYALSGYFAGIVCGYTCDYSTGFPIMTAVGDTMCASNLWSGWDWGSYGWAQVSEPSVSQFVPGAIWSMKGGLGDPFYTVAPWGHTGIVLANDGATITIIEQNAYPNYVSQKRTFDAYTFANACTGLVYPI